MNEKATGGFILVGLTEEEIERFKATWNRLYQDKQANIPIIEKDDEPTETKGD